MGGASFRTVVPDGKVSIFDDRWKWIDHASSPTGIWQDWLSMPATDQMTNVKQKLKERAESFSPLSPPLPVQ